MKSIKSILSMGLMVGATFLGAQSMDSAPMMDYASMASEGSVMEFGNVDVVRVNINSDRLDFSAIPYGNGIIYTSNEMGKSNNRWDARENIWCTDLMFARKTGFGQFAEPVKLQGTVNTNLHEGVVTFHKQSGNMIFSKNTKKVGKNGLLRMAIYQASQTGDGWGEVEDMKISSADFTTCHPSITPDGTTMFFASDRPGGSGGMDIWVCRWMNGAWSSPVNLGKEINTDGDELFPFAGPNGQLYFASEGHNSMGGLDVVAANRGDDGNIMNWTNVHTLKAPFNTDSDDFAFFCNQDGTTGYFASNRNQGTSDDIYEWRKSNGTAGGYCVVDAETGAAIADPMVSINGNKNMPNTMAPTATQAVNTPCGMMTMSPSMANVQVNKAGYKPYTASVPNDQLGTWATQCISLEKANTPTLSGKVINKNYKKDMPNASVALYNRCNGETKEVLSDANGNFYFMMDCECEYELVVTKKRFNKVSKKVTTINKCTSPGNEHVVIELENMDNMPVRVAPTPRPVTAPAPVPSPRVHTTTVTPAPTTTTTTAAAFSEGMIIRLDKVYYDYDKSFIRSDAAAELQHVVDMLNQYPSLEIELSSHTDSRGNNAYNRDLSQRRANAARNYILSKGIASHRITAAGKGESELVNQCADGVKCSDDDHQENRRTQIRVTRFNETGVRVIDSGR